MKTDALKSLTLLEGKCAGTSLCPLSRVQAGVTVCIKELATAPDLTERLRELGLGEEQKIKVLSRQNSFICLVCNARLGISPKLAENIMVETMPPAHQPA